MKKILSLICCLFTFGCTHQEVFLSGQYVLQTDNNINIMFEKNNFAGNSGVNRYFGDYTIDGSYIKINVAGTTMMMGPRHLMEKEQKYVGDLAKINRFEHENSKLILYTDSKQRLVFEKVK